MLFTMWLNLYATRLVLNNLGVEDMGVYGVVGSIVGMFTIFTSGITSAVQRFLTYEQCFLFIFKCYLYFSFLRTTFTRDYRSLGTLS